MQKILRNFFIFSLLCAVFVSSAPTVLALTADEIQAKIKDLQAQIESLMAQLKAIQGTELAWCHTFSDNLRYGDNPKTAKEEVLNLQKALNKEGIYQITKQEDGYFGDFTASAVVEFQEKYADEILKSYGLKRGTGYVGKSTRAVLNQLYGCKTKSGTCPQISLMCVEGYETVFKGLNANGCAIYSCVKKPETTTSTPICIQVITPAQNPATGECKVFPTPCDVPSAWQKVSSCPASPPTSIIPTCISEGQTGLEANNDVCCAGLTKISNSFPSGSACVAPINTSFVCSYSGNGVCGKGENTCNCASDCKTEKNLPPVIDGLTAPTQLKVNEQGTWKIEAHDPENKALSYKVSWGDEALPLTKAMASGANQVTQTTSFTHSYNAAGTYTVVFTVADDLQQTAKTSTTVKVVEEMEGLPDLTPISLEVKNLTRGIDEVWKTGDLIEVKVAIQNKGTESAQTAVPFRLYTTAAEPFDSEIPKGLAPQQIFTGTFVLTLWHEIGSFFSITLSVDPYDVVDEVYENNNSLSEVVTIQLPDLTATRLEVTNLSRATTDVWKAGDKIEARIRIENIGAVATPTTVSYTIDLGFVQIESETPTPLERLGIHETTHSVTLKKDITDTFSVSLRANHSYEIGYTKIEEQYETNNLLTQVIPIEAKIVTVISPNGGEKWEVGKSYYIEWGFQNVNFAGAKTVIHLVKKSKLGDYDTVYRTLFNFTNKDDVTDLKRLWTIPADIPVDSYKIQVVLYDISGSTEKLDDMSDAPFNIVPASII